MWDIGGGNRSDAYDDDEIVMSSFPRCRPVNGPGTKSGFIRVSTLILVIVVRSVADKFACQGIWAAIIIFISETCISFWQLITWPRRQCHSLIILYKPFTVFRQTIPARRPAPEAHVISTTRLTIMPVLVCSASSGRPFAIQLLTLEYSWKALISSCGFLSPPSPFPLVPVRFHAQAVDDVEPAQPWMLRYGLLLWTIYPILAFHP